MKWLHLKNNEGRVELSTIPSLEYYDFYEEMRSFMAQPQYHIGEYFGVKVEDGLRIYCLLLNDAHGDVMITSHLYHYYCEEPLESLTSFCIAVHPFEREITELYGVSFRNSKWNKPLRFAYNRADKSKIMERYPFYYVDSNVLHEVNVGPIHAGIIEPGAFRFICRGETVHHLEIALGYQHRGVEQAMVRSESGLKRMMIAESTAGDSSVSNSAAYVSVVEKLSGVSNLPAQLYLERVVAMELERIAVHIGDTAGMCTDIGYQLGMVACEALRTVVINTSQLWGGNRFGKGLIRPFGTNFKLTPEVRDQIVNNLTDVARRYGEVRENMKNTPSILAQFEECGVVDLKSITAIGGVGMAAKASGLLRDIRSTHPYWLYVDKIVHNPILKEFGDVMSRVTLRMAEVQQSIEYVISLISNCDMSEDIPRPNYDKSLESNSLAFSFVEGWRGEICHVALTNNQGELSTYKIKDPSVHNWLALALSMREEGISDFPICNKSFNLSYCGHDL